MSQKSCSLHYNPWAGNDHNRTARARQSQTGSIAMGAEGQCERHLQCLFLTKTNPGLTVAAAVRHDRWTDCTCASSGEIPSLIESPGGYDRWWINLNLPGIFFSTRPRRDVLKCEKSSCLKGPAILFMLDSLLNFLSTSSGIL